MMSGRAILRLGHLHYKLAGWHDWVNVLASYFWEAMYQLRLSREDVAEWLENFADRFAHRKATISPDFIPDDLVEHLARVMAMLDLPSGTIAQALIHKITNSLPAGYRWYIDDDGKHYVKRQHGGPPSQEKPIARGQKFIGQAFVGVWWHTDDPRSGASKQLQNALRKAGGGVFYKVTGTVGVTEYYAYVIVPEETAPTTGMMLDVIGKKLLAEGPTRDFRLSAARLDALAEPRKIGGEDIITVSGVFKSEKFNWEFTLLELLNGRHKNQDITGAVKAILKEFVA